MENRKFIRILTENTRILPEFNENWRKIREFQGERETFFGDIGARLKKFSPANETWLSGRMHLFQPCGVASRAISCRLYYGS